jgi:internalin A
MTYNLELYLPQELKEEIYKRLPGKDLFTLKCCSRTLRDSVDYFVELQWNQFKMSIPSCEGIRRSINAVISNPKLPDGALKFNALARRLHERILPYQPIDPQLRPLPSPPYTAQEMRTVVETAYETLRFHALKVIGQHQHPDLTDSYQAATRAALLLDRGDPQLHELSLQSQSLCTLPSLEKLSNLSTLNLSHNCFEETPQTIFNSPSVTDLDLSDNPLCRIPRRIHRLPYLKVLRLDHTQLETFPNIPLPPRLEALFLSENRFKAIPDAILGCSTLKSLSLSDNPLGEVSERISCMTQLESLELAFTGLQRIPPSLYLLSRLENLDLSDNLLKEVPPHIEALSNLQLLRLRDIRLKGFPTSVLRLPDLRTLSLSHNEIRNVPEGITSLVHLNELHLSSAHLAAFPSVVCRLEELSELFLKDNAIRALPDSISNCTSLVMLYLNGNRLSTLPEDFSRLENLRELGLSRNRFTVVPPELFSLPALECLDLSSNQIKKLPGAFREVIAEFEHINYFKNPELLIQEESWDKQLERLEELLDAQEKEEKLVETISTLLDCLKRQIHLYVGQDAHISRYLPQGSERCSREELTQARQQALADALEEFRQLAERYQHPRLLRQLEEYNQQL